MLVNYQFSLRAVLLWAFREGDAQKGRIPIFQISQFSGHNNILWWGNECRLVKISFGTQFKAGLRSASAPFDARHLCHRTASTLHLRSNARLEKHRSA